MRASSFNDKPTSKKGLLSMKAQLLKTRRDSVDAASIAAQKLDAAQRRLKAASDSHETPSQASTRMPCVQVRMH